MRRARCGLMVLTLFGCSEPEPLQVEPGCQPLLAGVDCVLPYPSDFFRRPTSEGYRVDLTGTAELSSDDNVSADVGDVRPVEGFSRLPLIVARFAEPASADALVGLMDPPEESLDLATSATLILNADTLEPVPHFADLDQLEGDGTRNALVLHPLVALAEGTRHVVAVSGLTSANGGLVTAPEGFRRLRDREERSDPAERFDAEVFEVLKQAGVDRGGLQLAWDFTTGLDQAVIGDMRDGRARARAALADRPPEVTITKVEEHPEDEGKALVWREIRGTITVPLIVDSDEVGATLLRDGEGRVRVQGTAELPFVALVPTSLEDAATPGRVICYGHGFFGDRREAVHEPPQRIADELGAVLFAIDWWGMSRADVTAFVDSMVAHPSEVTAFTDRVHQGMVNWMALTAALRGAMMEQEALKRPTGELLYDPSQLSFIGISQGHILGGVVAAVNPDIDRIVLNAGGAGMTHMIYRAKPFEPFLELMSFAMSDPLERLTFVATLQRHLDRIDPAVYAPYVLDAPFEDSPADRRILLQVGLGDTSVPDFTGFLHARLLGARLLTPSPIDVYGLEPLETGARGGLEVFDFGVDTSFEASHAPPPSKNEVHEGIRRLDAAIRQMDAFFRPGGEIVRACDGPCDPE